MGEASNHKPGEPRSFEVAYTDGRREALLVVRLSNTNMRKWGWLQCDPEFLTFHSVQFTDPNRRADQAWYDSLDPESAWDLTVAMCEVNAGPAQKKILAAVRLLLESWQSAANASSSVPGATPSMTTPTMG